MFDTFAFKGQKIINEPLVEYRDKIMSKCNLKKKNCERKKLLEVSIKRRLLWSLKSEKDSFSDTGKGQIWEQAY